MSLSAFLSGLILPLMAHAPAHPAEPAAPAAAAPAYLVSMTLHDGTTLVGEPALRVAAGEPAVVEIGDGQGHRYSVRMTVNPAEGDTLFVESAIDVATREGSYSARPALAVRSDLPAGILVGMVRDDSQPFRIDLTVSNVRTK